MMPTFASCPSCESPVVTRGDRCPWCDGDVTPAEVVAWSIQRATEATLLVQLATTKETT